MKYGVCLAVLGVVLFVGIWERGGPEEARPLTETEMRSLVGGHGGTSCDSCQNSVKRQDECAHFDTEDPCLADQCIENWVIENSCQVSAQSNCWAELDPDLDYLVQYLRSDSDCATDNPSKWEIWRVNYYGSTCKSRTYLTRCQKPSNTCNGTLIEYSSRSTAINCI
ncbi:MAG: hypothetical protein KC931_07490 [Candidatus Omnitrophica bacterium]|nr:hypothetical protein [Candidatus Omnitrophota bacterium]